MGLREGWSVTAGGYHQIAPILSLVRVFVETSGFGKAESFSVVVFDHRGVRSFVISVWALSKYLEFENLPNRKTVSFFATHSI